MSKVDDELTRRLHRAERPVDVDAVFDGLERRRSHRERVRRVQAAVLAVTVLAATVGGFAVLTRAFREQPEQPASPPPSPSAIPAGRDIGLGFNLCHLERLGGIDFLGDGTDGTAWTGTKVKSDGTCPASGYDEQYGVAVDFTGDGLADSWSGETIASCVMCAPFKATDLNGDGGEDLIVTLSYFSIMQYGLYTVMPVDGAQEVVPFRTEPGHPQHGLDVGAPFTFWVGGDAGYADWFYCDRLPELWLTGMESPIDGGPGDVTTWHETQVSLTTDATANILYADTYKVPYGTLIDHQHTTSKPDCGLGVDIQR